MSLTSAAVVAGVAVLAPLAIALTGARLPAIVLEILLGVLVGPQALGWARVDQPVAVLALIGLGFLLLLGGLEIDFDRLKGRVLGVTAAGFALSFLLAVAVGVLVQHGGLVRSPLLSLQDTTAEIRVRGAFLLLLLFAAVASKFGLEAILGAFLAGATLKLVDRDKQMTHTLLHTKLRAAGYGVFVPFFFVSTGMQLDIDSLVRSESTLARVPIFLAAMLVVRAIPAVLYRSLAERRRQLVAAGLLQATSLSIPIVAGQIGVDLGLIRPGSYVALVTAGLLSVMLFPLIALALLRPHRSSRHPRLRDADHDDPRPAVLVHTNNRGSWFQASIQAWIDRLSCGTGRWVPRRSHLLVSAGAHQ
jgi:Kef-type K+ transport system membrane component KefB